MDSGRRKGPICGIENCRSCIYDEGEDGYRYCENGHRKGDLVVGLDEDNFTSEARVRTRKKKDKNDDEKEFKYFKGQQAYDLYLKSLQLILRHQIWFLIHTAGLPTELETVIQDLWTLRILQLEPRISDSQQAYSSQTPAFDTSEDDSGAETKVLRKKLESAPTLLDSLALCYLGCLILRLPVTLGDVHHWITEGTMPYRRAIRHIPPAMKDRLPAQYHASLDPNGTLKLNRLHTAIVDLQVCFSNQHGIVWPSLNVPLLLWRYLRELALPLEVYDATIQLAEILGYDFALHTSGRTKMGARHLPEAQLAACLVISVKLLYPFTTTPNPNTSSEPAVALLNWSSWHETLASFCTNKEDGLSKLTIETLTNTKENDVFDMTERDMDQYMDFYQDSFIDSSRSENETSEFRRALYNMFPIESLSRQNPAENKLEVSGEDKQLEVVKTVHGTFISAKIIAEGDESKETVRPGQGYTFWKKMEDLPNNARRFYEETARTAGLEIDMLVTAVFFAEKSIVKWRKRGKHVREKGAEMQA